MTLALNPLLSLLTLAPAQFDDFSALQGQVVRSVPIFADLDADGLADLVHWDSVTRSISWIQAQPGTGLGPTAGGVPQPLVTLVETESGPYVLGEPGIVAADLDADGDLDLAFTGLVDSSFDQPRIGVAWNDGAGGFISSEVSLGPETGSPRSLAAVDLDSDGQLEIAVAFFGSGSSSTQVFVVDHAGGALGTPQPLLTGPPLDVRKLRVGDVTGDGVLDLVLGRLRLPVNDVPLAAVRPGTGFPLQRTQLQSVTGISSSFLDLDDVEVTDLDQDGDDDVVALNSFFPAGVFVWLQSTPGVFVAGPSLSLPITAAYSDLQLGDRDADGRIDLVFRTSQSFSATVSVLLNQGGGNFAPSGSATPIVEGRVPLAAGDATGDGRADLLSGSFFGASILTFAAAPPAPGDDFLAPAGLGEGLGRGAVGAFDADGDGFDDVLVVEQGRGAREAGVVGVKLNLGDARFGPLRPITGPGPADREPVTGDFDGDGAADVLVASADGTTFELHRGLGDGTFAAPLAALALIDAPLRIRVVDLDRDGIDDLVYLGGAGSRVRYAFGDPSGAFTADADIVGGFPQPVRPAMADLDGDGDVDLAYFLTDKIEVSLQRSGRSFESRAVLADISTFALPNEAAVAGDLDGDGDADLMVPGRFWLENLGGGVFGTPTPTIGAGSFSLRGDARLVDADGDGDLDLFAIGDNELIYAEALGPAEYATSVAIMAGGSDFAVDYALSDLDRDGDPDVVASLTNEAVLFFVNDARSAVGDLYCGPAVPNSTGRPSTIGASAPGAPAAPLTSLWLTATSLPTGSLGYFLTSRVQDDVPAVPNSVGRLCLGGSVGRFVGPGQVLDSGPAGVFVLEVDPTALPTPNLGLVPANAGETWNFQAWHRDLTAAGSLTSNFTPGISVTF